MTAIRAFFFSKLGHYFTVIKKGQGRPKVADELKATYRKEFRMDFLTQAKKYVPEFAAVKADLKKLAKDVVNDIENQYHETSLKR